MDWLERTDIDRILDGLSAEDLIESLAMENVPQIKKITDSFNRAALRLGASTETEPALQRVRAQDLKYLTTRMGEVINVDSPLSEGTVRSLDSAATGG
jgi:hypothetical protein